MGAQSGENVSWCCCYEKEMKYYEKILDLKDTGLIIYRQRTRHEENTKTDILPPTMKQNDEDNFILQNTKDVDILPTDILFALNDNKITCPRCRLVFQNARKLLQRIPKISRNDIMGICDHCRRKIFRSPCKCCDDVVKKFISDRDKEKNTEELNKISIAQLHWSSRNVVNEEKYNLKHKIATTTTTHNVPSSEINLRKYHFNTNLTSREPVVTDLIYPETLKILSKRSICKSDRTKKITTFLDLVREKEHFILSEDQEFNSQSYQDVSYLSPLELPRNDDFGVTKSIPDATFKTIDKPVVEIVPAKMFSQESLIFPGTRHYPSEDAIKPLKRSSKDYFTSHTKHLSEKTLLSQARKEKGAIPHRKFKSEEFLFTSISGMIKDTVTKDFGYFFPKTIDDKERDGKKNISSSELIKDTQDKLQARFEEEQRRKEEARINKEKKQKEAQEKKIILKEEAKKRREERREKAKRLFEDSLGYTKEVIKVAGDTQTLGKEEPVPGVRAKSLGKKEESHGDKKNTLKKDSTKMKTNSDTTITKTVRSVIKNYSIDKLKVKKPPTEKHDLKESHSTFPKGPTSEQSKVRELSPGISKTKESPSDSVKKTVLISDKPEVEESLSEKSKPKESILKKSESVKEPTSGKPKEEVHLEKLDLKELPSEKIKIKETLNDKTKQVDLPPEKLQVDETTAGKLKTSTLKQDPKDKQKIDKTELISKEKEQKKVKKEKGSSTTDVKESVNKEQKSLEKSKVESKEERGMDAGFRKLIEEQAKLKEQRQKLKKQEEEEARKARAIAEKKLKEEEKQPTPTIKLSKHPELKSENSHENSADIEIEIDLKRMANEHDTINTANIIIGPKVFQYRPPVRPQVDKEEDSKVPVLFKSTHIAEDSVAVAGNTQEVLTKVMEEETKSSILLGLTKGKGKVQVDQETPKGVIRYALSDRTFIDKGWTMLPTEKVVRKMNVYRMRPAHPEFDWFEHNKNKRLMTYETGERLAEFDDNGRGRWYYKNGRLALDYYDAEEINAQQRFVVYSSGEPNEHGRSCPITILATFDYLGNGVVFDHSGKIRLKYNQTEGVVLDRAIGPVSHWKWHTLNDPPVLQQVMIDTQMPRKDPEITKLGGPGENKPRPDNEEMLAIEFDNFIKEKSKKLTQKFKPFQIKMKALKINENFSLKVLDQATVYLIFRDGSANLKLNIGMILDHKEIVDTDTAEVGEVSNNVERLPARTESIAGLQRSVANAQRRERMRVQRERRLRPPEPCASADRLTAAAKPLRTVVPPGPQPPSTTTSFCRCRKQSSNNLYYDNRLF